MQTKAQAKLNPAKIHDSLKLPTRYKVRIKIEGHVAGKDHHRVYKLCHDTIETYPVVYAHSVNWSDWVTIDEQHFKAIARAVLGLN